MSEETVKETKPKVTIARSAPKGTSHQPNGAWITYGVRPWEADDGAVGGTAFTDVVLYTSEIAALRVAVADDRKVVFVAYGQTLEDAIAEKAKG